MDILTFISSTISNGLPILGEAAGPYILAGMVTGLLSGLLGIGGGIIIVPLLLFLFQKDPTIVPEIQIRLATGSALAVMMFTSLVTIRNHLKHGELLVTIYRRLLPGIGLGTLAGSVGAYFIASHVLKALFVGFLFFAAIKMFFDRNKVPGGHFPQPSINRLISFVIGSASGLLGIGGGVLLLPYLNYCGIELRKIPGVLALCTLTIAVMGTLMYVLLGMNDPQTPWGSLGYVNCLPVFYIAIPSCLMAPFGVRLSYILPVKQLRYVFINLLIITAISLLPGGTFVSLPQH